MAFLSKNEATVFVFIVSSKLPIVSVAMSANQLTYSGKCVLINNQCFNVPMLHKNSMGLQTPVVRFIS